MIASTQITNTEIFALIAVLVFNLLTRKFFYKITIAGMQNLQDTFETRKRSFISAFSICMNVSLIKSYISISV